MSVGSVFARRILCIWSVLCLWPTALCQAPENVRELVLENEQVHVSRVSVAPHSKAQLRQARDTVVVHLDDGEAEFFRLQSLATVDNPGDKPTTEIIVELKRHWDAEVHLCAAPMRCTRETTMAGNTIAWTTTLFSNGFLTAMRHKLVRGGTLNSSYYSAKGSDHILLIPLTDLQANFGGIDEQLRTGQAYFSAATEVEVTGKDAEARWVVIRLHTPAK